MGEQGRPKRTRREKELRLAVGLTVGWAIVAFFLIYPQGPLRAIMLPSVVAGTAVVAVIWCLVFLSLRLRTERDQSLDQLQGLSAGEFEKWVAARFREIGYRVKRAGGDHSGQLIAEKPGERAIVHCARSRTWRIGETPLHDLYDAIQELEAQEGYLVTTGRLTGGARRWAHGKPLAVWDGEELARLARAPVPPQPKTSQPAAAKEPAPPGPICPRCGALLVVRQADKAGETYLGCSRFPACQHKQPLAP